jgi:hypothetical protein
VMNDLHDQRRLGDTAALFRPVDEAIAASRAEVEPARAKLAERAGELAARRTRILAMTANFTQQQTSPIGTAQKAMRQLLGRRRRQVVQTMIVETVLFVRRAALWTWLIWLRIWRILVILFVLVGLAAAVLSYGPFAWDYLLEQIEALLGIAGSVPGATGGAPPPVSPPTPGTTP